MSKFILAFAFLILASCRSTNPDESGSSDTDKADLHHQVAISYIKNENYPMALKELQTAEKLDPQNPAIIANLGLVYFARERYEQAEAQYKKAIRINPDFTDAKNNLARIYTELERYKLAEPLLIEVLDDLTYVNFPSAYANYGFLEFKRKNYNKAVDYLKKSLEKDRENCKTHVLLGRSYLEQKQLKMASNQLEKAINFCKEAGLDQAHFYSAIVLYRLGEKQKAKFRFDEQLSLYPNGENSEKAEKMREYIKKDTP
jgi:Tfp pilus assembly protein PilF